MSRPAGIQGFDRFRGSRRGGAGAISVSGAKVAEGRIEGAKGFVFSGNETAGVRYDDATNVTPDYNERDNAFTGKINRLRD
ncbi:MAG: hypothetical protein IT424_12500 [Pirellulales bacterium]|nr:hypothetical protein [Pirellulales bacterium]